MPVIDAELAALAAHLTARREQLLRAWRGAVKSDSLMTSAAALPREQLHDHIPALLMDYERALAAGSASDDAVVGEGPQRDAAAHGVTRWQQGFDLAEVARELGRLNECMVTELDTIPASVQPQPSPLAKAIARARWARLYSLAVSGSTAQYDKLRQIEAAEQINDLEGALTALRDLEQQRADLWEQAAHDLRGNLGVVANASAGLNSANTTAAARDSFLQLLDRNVSALHRVLDDVTSLARLQGGQEQRRTAPMDAAAMLKQLCSSLQPQAQQRALALSTAGPDALAVEGDTAMTQRIVHNLVLDAIRNTSSGGVTVQWGQDAARDGQRWFIDVRDTGPRRRALDASLIAATLRPVDHEQQPAPSAEQAQAAAVPIDGLPPNGIGMAIVKRLCELLDAALQVESTDDGTVFRITLPLRYHP